MRQSIRRAAFAFALVTGAGFTAGASAQPAPVQQTCQRDCLEGFVDKYLAAMAAHKVDPALFAANVRFTENGVELPFGNEGLWATASGVGKYKLYVPDTETQNVAFLGTVVEQAQSSATGPSTPPALVGLALRLRIVDGRITEVEQIAARPDRPLGPTSGTASSNPFPATGEAVEAMGAPNPIFLKDIPAGQRQSRADLIRVGNYYFDAVERNTGHDYYPFSDSCLRHENGIITAAPPGYPPGRLGPMKGCKEQLQTTLIGAVTGIRDRRFVAIDRERGIAFAFAFFDHRPINWSWQLGELFKIEGEEITQVEAIFIRGPYGMCEGWSTYEQCRSEAPHDAR